MVFFVLAFLFLSLGAVAYPLLTTRESRPDGSSGEAEELAEEKQSALSAIQDLEFEHAIGNLSEPDFASLREEYTERAARVLQRLDRLPPEPRSSEPAALVEWAERSEEQEELEDIEEYCTACGETVGPEDHYCGSCGAHLLEGTCPRCGAPLDEDDRFCPRCGRKVVPP